MKYIRAHELQKVFEKEQEQLHVLGPLSFEILPGEFLCVLGESGCGKSTLWRILAGLEKPSQGQVYMDDEIVTAPDHRRGVVFQSPALLPWLTVEENIGLGFNIRGEKIPKDLINDTITLVGLKGFEKMRPAALSGGMAQRTAIARALVGKPDVLLMDEPFAALDALTRLRMQEALLDIWKRRGITIVFITHDIDEAIALASRVIVMTPRPGRISRIFEIPLAHPRKRGAADFLQLRGVVSDQLIQSFNDSKNAMPAVI